MEEKLKEKFKKLPLPLKKQILCKISAGGLSLLMFTLILIFAHDFILSLPCLILSGYLIINGGTMLLNCAGGQYVTIRGICTEIERVMFRKRIKTFYISSEEGIWKIFALRKTKGITVGAYITVFMSNKTRVYEQAGIFIVSGFYTCESRII